MKTLLTGCALALSAGATPQLVAQDSQGSPPRERPSSYVLALEATLERARERVRQAIDIWEDHSTWENAWVVRSDHFAVRTTRSYGFGMDVALGLEDMLGHFQTTLGTEFTPAQPLPVSVFPTLAEYNAFGGNADEHSSFYGSFYANTDPQLPVAALYVNNPISLKMQITHSVVHQYLAAAYPGVTIPTWVDEGLAAYFSIYWDYDWGWREWMRIRDNKMQLSTLLNDQLPAYTANTHRRFIQLGMLFYYLLRFREDTRTTGPNEEEQRGPFRDYLVSVLRGETDVDSPLHAMLTQPEELERALVAYEFPR